MTLQNLLPAANILQLFEVQDACCEFLRSQLHPSNCLGINAFADLHACTELTDYTQMYIEQHFRWDINFSVATIPILHCVPKKTWQYI